MSPIRSQLYRSNGMPAGSWDDAPWVANSNTCELFAETVFAMMVTQSALKTVNESTL
jgi:hypothetical protein